MTAPSAVPTEWPSPAALRAGCSRASRVFAIGPSLTKVVDFGETTAGWSWLARLARGRAGGDLADVHRRSDRRCRSSTRRDLPRWSREADVSHLTKIWTMGRLLVV